MPSSIISVSHPFTAALGRPALSVVTATSSDGPMTPVDDIPDHIIHEKATVISVTLQDYFDRMPSTPPRSSHARIHDILREEKRVQDRVTVDSLGTRNLQTKIRIARSFSNNNQFAPPFAAEELVVGIDVDVLANPKSSIVRPTLFELAEMSTIPVRCIGRPALRYARAVLKGEESCIRDVFLIALVARLAISVSDILFFGV
ncbi:hypothetical protein EXIGLDRAFT_784496 [Exidia glandulosa HHB12029]|uniref:Uncharacterized protein n=1 Tax=Exidia glandulosa HHB12029 TaxID=1314781 RepID=A0A166MF84_EXIGL|nr:hypothetical protein EXIGLDRAFT_784496 [Exidia glandulosa HHB12029]